MEKRNFFANTKIFYNLNIIAAILAVLIVYFCFIDKYIHSLLFIFLYILLFAHIIVVSTAFKKGYKEVSKAAIAGIFTTSLIFHAIGFIDMIELNQYYFFSGNILMTFIGVIACLLLILFIFAYVNHYRINETNQSETSLVTLNKKILFTISILSILEAFFIFYNAFISNRSVTIYLVLTYILFSIISLIIISMEELVNVFRIAREQGRLDQVVEEMVGKKAAEKSSGKKH